MNQLSTPYSLAPQFVNLPILGRFKAVKKRLKLALTLKIQKMKEDSMISNRRLPTGFIQALCATLLVGHSASALTDLQKRLISPEANKSKLVQQYSLNRLWAFDDAKDLQDDSVMGNGRDGKGSLLINKGYNLNSISCQGRDYAYFKKGMVESDETMVIENLLKAVKPTDLEDGLATTKKIWDHLKNEYPNFIPSSSSFDPNSRLSKKIAEAISKEQYRQDIQKSSSLVEIKNDKRTGQAIVNSTDYTVGGWFKPSKNSKDTNNTMTLMTKKFMSQQGQMVTEEWKIFITGNAIYFHNFRDGAAKAYSKYLSATDAVSFRNKITNMPYYSESDYYEDVLAKPVAGQQNAATQPIALTKIFLDDPSLPQTKKPIPGPGPIPVPPPPPITPPQPPIPPGPVPTPPTPPPIVIPPGSGKEYTANFDMKHFWWASTVGSCYGCEKAEQHRDAWYYVSLSVHLNDPLGPYVDITVILDPNERIFGTKATLANHLKTARWELDRNMLSRPALTPFEKSAPIEKGCKSDTCTRSVLEIGSIDQNVGYSGFMRGVYIAKKALRANEVLDMASQFYPNDAEQCTYMLKAQQ